MIVGNNITVVADYYTGTCAGCNILSVEAVGLYDLGRDLNNGIRDIIYDLVGTLVNKLIALCGCLYADLVDHELVAYAVIRAGVRA